MAPIHSPVHRVEIIGVPSDLGANIRGANMGPSAIRIANLHDGLKRLGYEVFDYGDLQVPVRETLSENDVKAKYLPQVAAISNQLFQLVFQALTQERIPLCIGGDHSLALSSVAAVSHFYKSRHNKDIGLLWFDAHADINTPESSESQNIHGMPVATLLGLGHRELIHLESAKQLGFMAEQKISPEKSVLIGIRDIDEKEKELCLKSGIRYFTMRQIDERGIVSIMQEAIAIASKGTAGIHVSFDIDGIDPLYAPGVSTPVLGGLTYRESHLALEMIADTGKLLAMDLVEVNPMTDQSHKTGRLAVELIQSAFGKAII